MPTGSPRPRAARLHDHGKPLVVEEVDLPVPGEDEVLVEMAFAGVNPADRYVAEGRLAPDAPGCTYGTLALRPARPPAPSDPRPTARTPAAHGASSPPGR